jgi:hypothetical protein
MKIRGRTMAAIALLVGAGVVGAAGIAGAGLKQVSTTVTIADHAPGSATAKCKRGTKTVSGGFDAPGFDLSAAGPFVNSLASERTAKRRWTVDAFNAGDGEGQLRAFAYCTAGLPKLKARTVTRTVDAQSNGAARAKCPKGGEAVSGGFVAGDQATDPIYPYMSRRNGDRTWTVQAYNGQGSTGLELTAIAYCAKHELGLRRKVGETFFTEPEAITSETARCGKGFKAISGGFTGPSRQDLFELYPFRSLRSGGRAWTAAAATYVNGMDAGARWEVYAYCIKNKEL